MASSACQRSVAEHIAPRLSAQVDRYSLHVNFSVRGHSPPLDAHIPIVIGDPFKVSHTTDDGIEIEVSGTVSSPSDGKFPATIIHWYGRPDTPVHRRNRGTTWPDLELGKGMGVGSYVSGVVWNMLCVTLSKAEPIHAEPLRPAESTRHSDGREGR